MYTVMITVVDNTTGRTISRSLVVGESMVQDPGAWMNVTSRTLAVKMGEALHVDDATAGGEEHGTA
jgi:hypothetical protein